MQEQKNQPLATVAPEPPPSPRGALALTGAPVVIADPTSTAPPGLAGGPTLASLVQAIRRRWLLTFGIALLGGTSAVLAVLSLWPAKYAASARLQIASRGDPGIFAQTDHDEDFLTFKTNIAAALKSPLFLNTALKSDEAQKLALVRDNPGAAEWLSEALKTDFKGPGILEVRLGADNGGEVAALLNVVLREFIKDLRLKDASRRSTKTRELESSLAARKRKLDEKRSRLRTLEHQGGFDDLETAKVRFAAILARRSAVEKDLSDCGKEQAKIQQQLVYFARAEKDLPSRALTDKQLDDALEKDPRAQGILLQIASIEKDILGLRNVQEPRLSQELKVHKSKKAFAQQELLRLRSEVRPELERRARADIADEIAFKKESAELKLQELKEEEVFLREKVKSVEMEADKTNPSRRPDNMIALAEDIREEDYNLQKLSEKIGLLAMEPPASSRVTVLQEALEPMNKDMSRHYKVAGAAGIGLFGLLLFGMALVEFRTRRISAATDVSDGLGMSLVATLPPLPQHARNGHTPRDQHLQNRLTEAVDGLRTMLLHAARTEKLHTVMVTSALGGEGKTSLASQLAASLARAWRKTLLIDGDLRNPAAHKLFDVPQEPGFCEVLRGEAAVNDSVRPTSLSRLWIMPAGQWDAHAVQALAQENVHDLFEQLKQQYDFIVVDSSPVLPVADALLLGQHVDGVLLSVLRDVSRTPAVYAAQQRLNNLSIRTLGAVVIGDPGGPGSLAYHYPARSV